MPVSLNLNQIEIKNGQQYTPIVAVGSVLTDLDSDFKTAILQLAQKVAYIDDQGATYYAALESALTHRTLSSISAVYTQSGTVYDTDSLDSLKADLVVTATYSDSSTATVAAADYTLSGTLTEGTSTITVIYGGKTTTFSVTVTAWTWFYDASSGEKLSEQNYVTFTSSGEGGTEAVSDGHLLLHTNVHVGTTGSAFLRYNFSEQTSTHALLRSKAKLTKAVGIFNDNIGNSNGFRMQLSNGTGGVQLYTIDNGDGKILVKYYEGSTAGSVATDFALSDFHLFEVELDGSTQTIRIDGEQVFTSNTLSTNYATANAILNQAGNSKVSPNGVDTDIEYVAFLEVS